MRIINISDLHISPYKNPYDYYNELSFIIDYIDDIYLKNNKLDMLVFNGDFFDEFYSASSAEINVASTFITNIYKRAHNYGFNIFFLKGTYSHGDSQLSIYKPIFDERVRFVENVSYFEVCGAIVRFIPEYYSATYEELEEKAFKDMADITFMHGTIEGCGIFAKQSGASQVKNAQVIKIADLRNSTRIFTVAGHIHNRNQIAEDIWYTGSYTSSSFSDAGTKKGFDDITVDLDLGTYEVKHVINRSARNFKIYDATEVIKFPLQKARVFFNELKMDRNELDIIRIDVNCNGYNDDNLNNLNIIRSQFKDVFQFKINRDIVQMVASKDILADAEKVLSPTVSIVDKIAWGIKEVYDIDMADSRIRQILDLPEVL